MWGIEGRTASFYPTYCWRAHKTTHIIWVVKTNPEETRYFQLIHCSSVCDWVDQKQRGLTDSNENVEWKSLSTRATLASSSLSTAELQRKLEVCHHRFLRKMIGITIYDVSKRPLHLQQTSPRGSHVLHNPSITFELPRARWLKKLALMNDNRGPKNTPGSWIYNAPRKIRRST